MSAFDILALLLTLAGLFSYVNYRFVGLPPTVGLMLLSLILSLVLVVAGRFNLSVHTFAEKTLAEVNFRQALLGGALSFLLFAGSLHGRWEPLREQRWPVALLATAGVFISTALVGGLSYGVLTLLGLHVPLVFCVIFGALISPTDPIAVLGLLKQARAPEALATQIAGESLFNDGMGIVVFLVVQALIYSGAPVDGSDTARIFLVEVAGGVTLGLALGWMTYRLLKSVDNYQVEILLTLAIASGGYALAAALHTSGPLAVVVAGVVIGNMGRDFAMSAQTWTHLHSFWEIVDEVLNAMLFVFIGLQVLVLRYHPGYVLAAVTMIPVVLAARLVSVALPAMMLRLAGAGLEPHSIKLLTWGGLRGAISVALALSLPAGNERDLILIMTYAVAAFSILIQGATMPWLLRRTLPGINALARPTSARAAAADFEA